MKFIIEKKLKNTLGRAGTLETPHGVIHTPAFVVVGTKATVKALSPEQVKDLGAEVVLGNTYHLYLQPGDEIIQEAGGLGRFMNWPGQSGSSREDSKEVEGVGPTMTDSGGFQAFSLGADFGKRVGKIGKKGGLSLAAEPRLTRRMHGGTVPAKHNSYKPIQHGEGESQLEERAKLAKIDEDGITFKSHIDGSEHRLTPERSIEIQHNLGADIIFALDECTSPLASHEYQREAMDRTHRWAERSLARHEELNALRQAQGEQPLALFGIVQGGRFEDLRKESARVIGDMDFDGFGIGGSFEKEDMYTVVGWVNSILPEEKPRHLLGIGEPQDLFGGIENGTDLFDCVAPTRMGRNGSLYTHSGRINILNAKYRNDFSPIEEKCGCYTCSPRHGGASYTRAYVAHLFRAKEMFASTLASIHNLYFIVNLVKKIRQSILDETFFQFKEEFLKNYYK